MKWCLAAACLLGLASVAATQDRKPVPSRDFVVRIEASESPAFRELWVSRDGGKTWKIAREAGVSTSWGEWVDGTIRCTLRVPEDGPYDFYAQLGDSITNRIPEPRPGQPADPKLRCDVRDQGMVVWEYPAVATAWPGGEQVQLRWSVSGGDLKDHPVRLLYTTNGKDWLTITEGLEPAGMYTWVVPGLEAGKIRLRAVARTRTGPDVSGDSVEITVRASERPQIAKARALYDRARVLHAQQRPVEAEIKYQEALSAWPEFGEVFNDLGKLCAERKDQAKALEYFLRARRLCPSDPTPWVNGARMRLELGLVEDALADLKDAVELGVEKDERTAVLAGETLYTLARRALEANDSKHAQEALETLLRIRQAARTTQGKARQLLESLRLPR
jgi:hypothetical protein